ncbi:MAG: CRISPR-associated protein [Bacteroides sp.]|nr:CRISPR-associated protein [Bacteroides sp.]
MLINLSNHPYAEWSETQKEAAKPYGKCVDLPFPAIPPDFTDKQTLQLAETYCNKIISMGTELTVHIMGEQTFCFSLISMLINQKITCIASCSARDVVILPDGSKQVRFHFTRFRDYIR